MSKAFLSSHVARQGIVPARILARRGCSRVWERTVLCSKAKTESEEMRELREENQILKNQLESLRRNQEGSVSRGNGSMGPRTSTKERKTKETKVKVVLDLDGSGRSQNKTGVGFLDHMLDQLASHGLFDLEVTCEGDLWIDDHHSVEDVAITLGQAFKEALGDKRGIRRFGTFTAPLDESLVSVTLDLSGRPHTQFHDYTVTSVERIGDLSTHMVEHFFESFASTSLTTLHIQQIHGRNPHHIVEATFKAFARSLRMAVELDPRNAGVVPSSKGSLTH